MELCSATSRHACCSPPFANWGLNNTWPQFTGQVSRRSNAGNDWDAWVEIDYWSYSLTVSQTKPSASTISFVYATGELTVEQVSRWAGSWSSEHVQPGKNKPIHSAPPCSKGFHAHMLTAVFINLYPSILNVRPMLQRPRHQLYFKQSDSGTGWNLRVFFSHPCFLVKSRLKPAIFTFITRYRWLTVNKTILKHRRILLTFASLGFVLKLPSHKFPGSLL